MRKLLFLLLCTVSMYGQAEFDAGIQITGGQTTTSTSNKLLSQEADGVVNYIPALSLPLSTANISALQKKADLSTGLIKNGLITINADPTKYDISAGIGIISNFDDPENPVSTLVNFSATTGKTPAYLNTGNITYIAINSAGTVIESASQFTVTQRRDLIILGAVIHSNLTSINVVNNISAPTNAVGNQLHDFMEAIGALNITGNKYTANGANLQLNKSAGSIFKFGVNFATNWKDPHEMTQGAETSLTFRYRIQNGTEGSDRINLDPALYDLGNVLTAVPNNKFTIQTVTMFQTGLTRIQYGQTVYDDLASAQNAIFTRDYVVENNILMNGVTRAYIILKNTTTSLQNTADARIVEAQKFGGVASGGVALTFANIVTALGYTPENIANKATDFTTVDNIKYPTVQAVKTYADGLVVGLLNDRGSYSAASGTYPTTGGSGTAGAVMKGNLYSITVGGVLGGVAVTVGDWLRALVDDPGQIAANWSVVEGNFGYVPANDANVMHLTGTETVNGDKTFTSTVTGLGFVKSGGLSTEFLKANGSVDTTVYAPLASPTFTGTPTAPTATVGTNTAQLATTAFVTSAVGSGILEFNSTDMTVWNNGKSNVNGNTSFGEYAMASITSGQYNTGIGSGALRLSSTGGNNTSLGIDALGRNTTGTQNTGVGAQAGNYLSDGATANSTGGSSVFIGSNTFPLGAGQTNQIVIGAYANGAGSNTATLGNTSITTTRLRGAVQGGSFVKDGGTSSQFLKADGSSDGTAYVAGTGTTNYIPKWTAAGTQGNSAWQESSTGSRLFDGIDDGVNKLQVNGSGKFTSASADQIITKRTSGAIGEYSLGVGGSANTFLLTDKAQGLTRAGIDGSGNFGIGLAAYNVAIPYKLDVNGTGRFSGALNIGSLAGTGTRTVVADASGNLSTQGVGYKVYAAILAQTGTSAPTATVLENTLGGTVTFTYNSSGNYSATATGLLTGSKTIGFITARSNYQFSVEKNPANNNTIDIATNSAVGSATDGLMTNTPFEIRVYN